MDKEAPLSSFFVYCVCVVVVASPPPARLSVDVVRRSSASKVVKYSYLDFSYGRMTYEVQSSTLLGIWNQALDQSKLSKK